MWGQILAAAAPPIISGLFGSKKATAQGVDYRKLRRDATAAGFNPLTALLAGGGQGYQREFNPALSSGSFIAEAVARGTDTYFDGMARRDAQADAIRDHANKKDLIAYEHSLRPQKTFGYDLTQVQPFGSVGRSGRPALSRSNSDDAAQSDEGLNPATKPIIVGGKKFYGSGRFSDAEAFEARYGEIGGMAYGVAALADDVFGAAQRAIAEAGGHYTTVQQADGTWKYVPRPPKRPKLAGRKAKPIYDRPENPYRNYNP